MVDVEVPPGIHETVKNYAQERGLSVPEAYQELLEYSLTEVELETEEDPDPREGIM